MASGARVHRVELFGTFVKVGIFAVGISTARGGFPEQTCPRGVVALTVIVKAARGGAARLGGSAGGTYTGLFLGDCFEVERFGTEGFGGWGVGEGG